MHTSLFARITFLFFALSIPAMADDLRSLKLQDVYALPEAELEERMLESLVAQGISCEWTSSVANGEKDPAKLTAAQACAVGHYSAGGYSVNAGLWETDPSGSALNGAEWAYVRVLDLALAKIPAEPKRTVYRGTSVHSLKLVKGQTVRLKGYTSTSTQPDVAEGFVGDRWMVIETISGRNIQRYSNAGGEEEILLPRSSWVRVDRVERKKMDIFSEEEGRMISREVEVVHLTEVKR